MGIKEIADRLEPRQLALTSDDEVAYKQHWQQGPALLEPLEAAFLGGVLADRLSWVFVAAYQSAVRSCFAGVPEGCYSCFAVSEDAEGEHPGTSLDQEGRLNGAKSWIASSRVVDHMVVTIGPNLKQPPVAVAVGKGVDLSHREAPGFLGDMSQGFAHFDGVPVVAVGDHQADKFGLMEPFFMMAAGAGYLLREAQRLALADLTDEVWHTIQSIDGLYIESFLDDIPRFLDVYNRVATLGRGCTDACDGDGSRQEGDWKRNGRLLGMYGRALRARG